MFDIKLYLYFYKKAGVSSSCRQCMEIICIAIVVLVCCIYQDEQLFCCQFCPTMQYLKFLPYLVTIFSMDGHVT